jgi:3-hydroxyisobutyrate dehydrogenase-like beta-hydroxyacid dehydrogenase
MEAGYLGVGAMGQPMAHKLLDFLMCTMRARRQFRPANADSGTFP